MVRMNSAPYPQDLPELASALQRRYPLVRVSAQLQCQDNDGRSYQTLAFAGCPEQLQRYGLAKLVRRRGGSRRDFSHRTDCGTECRGGINSDGSAWVFHHTVVVENDEDLGARVPFPSKTLQEQVQRIWRRITRAERT